MRRHFSVKSLLFSATLFFMLTPPVYALNELLEGPADPALGAHQWANNCSRCHNFRAPTEYSPGQWRVIMMHMHTVAGLTGQETRNIYAFLSQNTPVAPEVKPVAEVKTSDTKANEPAPKSGEEVYKSTCIACHGANGKGAIPGAANFVDHTGVLSKSDSVLIDHIENGYHTPGKTMVMPPKGGNPSLTHEDLVNVLQYIRKTFGK